MSSSSSSYWEMILKWSIASVRRVRKKSREVESPIAIYKHQNRCSAHTWHFPRLSRAPWRILLIQMSIFLLLFKRWNLHIIVSRRSVFIDHLRFVFGRPDALRIQKIETIEIRYLRGRNWASLVTRSETKLRFSSYLIISSSNAARNDLLISNWKWFRKPRAVHAKQTWNPHTRVRDFF